MAVEGSGSSVIEDSLIRYIDVKNSSEDIGGFSSSDSERDIESENKAEYIRGIMNFTEIDMGAFPIFCKLFNTDFHRKYKRHNKT